MLINLHTLASAHECVCSCSYTLDKKPDHAHTGTRTDSCVWCIWYLKEVTLYIRPSTLLLRRRRICLRKEQHCITGVRTPKTTLAAWLNALDIFWRPKILWHLLCVCCQWRKPWRHPLATWLLITNISFTGTVCTDPLGCRPHSFA